MSGPVAVISKHQRGWPSRIGVCVSARCAHIPPSRTRIHVELQVGSCKHKTPLLEELQLPWWTGYFSASISGSAPASSMKSKVLFLFSQVLTHPSMPQLYFIIFLEMVSSDSPCQKNEFATTGFQFR